MSATNAAPPQAVSLRRLELAIRRLRRAHTKRARDLDKFSRHPLNSVTARKASIRNMEEIGEAEKDLMDMIRSIVGGAPLTWNSGKL